MRLPEVNKIIHKYQDIPYSVTRGPWTAEVEGREHSIDKGVNCQYFYHEFLEATTGFQLDSNMLSKEIYEDDELFVPLAPPPHSRLEIADIFLFGKDTEPSELDTRTLHMAAFSGEYENDSPLLIHFFGKRESIDENGVVCPEDTGLQIWSLNKFNEERYTKYYGKIWAVKRLDPDVHLYRSPKESPTVHTIVDFFNPKER